MSILGARPLFSLNLNLLEYKPFNHLNFSSPSPVDDGNFRCHFLLSVYPKYIRLIPNYNFHLDSLRES